jgi:hypothetical protein
MNIDQEARRDCVLVDSGLHKAGSKMVDLLNTERTFEVKMNKASQTFVCVPLEAHAISILQAAK